VVRSDPAVDPATRAQSVWVELSEAAPLPPLRQGQAAQVTLVADSSAPVVAVPRSAVVREGRQAFLFVEMADSSFDRRPVQLGREDDSRVEIRSGLRPGERVAIEGVAGLQTAFGALR
jgi:membrane fusion protein, heavy metal efflux system